MAIIMKHEIDKARLREMREFRKLSQEQLAQRARLNKQTIYRMESGLSGRIRSSSLEALAKALGTQPDVLTGAASLPHEEMSAKQERTRGLHKLKDPVDGSVRNAYTLVSIRYDVPIARIVELAPLLFFLLAEKSLQRRRDNLEKLASYIKSANEMYWNFAHLAAGIIPGNSCADAIADEAQSIEAKDILGHCVEDAGHIGDNENPFARYLQELAEDLSSPVKLDACSEFSARYEICREDLLALTANDELLAKLLSCGDILLHEMPRELLGPSKVDQRLDWFRNHLIGRVRDGWTPPIPIPNSVPETESREELCEWFKSKLDASKAATTKQHRSVAPLTVVATTTELGGDHE